MTDTIYVVRGSCGEYSDRSEWLVCWFDNEALARDYAMRVLHEARTQIAGGAKPLKLPLDPTCEWCRDWCDDPIDYTVVAVKHGTTALDDLQQVMRNVADGASLYIALHDSDGELASRYGYARQPVTFSAARDNTSSNASPVTFRALGGPWRDIRQWSVWDSPEHSSGHLLYVASWLPPLPTPWDLYDDHTVTFSVGSLTIAAPPL